MYINFYSHNTDVRILHLEQEDWAMLLPTVRFPAKISQEGLGTGGASTWVCVSQHAGGQGKGGVCCFGDGQKA